MSQRLFSLTVAGAFSMCGAVLHGQQRVIQPDLAALASGSGVSVTAANRSVSAFTDGARHGLRISAGAGEGAAFLQGVDFSNGTIELDIRGKDAQGQSFVGLAFHGGNSGGDSATYEAIYFRPF